MRWRLLPEEFGPKRTHVKGMNNIVADALSWLDIAKEDLSAEMFTDELVNKEEDFPTGYPLSYKEIVYHQKKDGALQNKFRMQPELYIKKSHMFSDSTYKLITKNNKLYFPKYLQHKCAEWYHLTLMHRGEKRLELTIAQHYAWIGLSTTCVCVCKRSANCAVCKKRNRKHGLLPPKPTPEIILWHMLCIDLVGPYTFWNEKKPETYIELHCMMMIDPVMEIGEKTANVIANWLDIHWISIGSLDIPCLRKSPRDKGSEFAAEVSNALTNE